ncbi:MAG: serine/threonine-protein kinase, partial [Betaproteobacteria bacterium]
MASRPDDDLTIGSDVAVTSDSPSSGRGGGSGARRSAFAPGAIVAGRYRLVSLLGRGGMGEVYRADDLTLDHPVALKFLPEGVASDPGRLAQFHNELRVARQVSHKNVCRLYDLGEADGRRFLTMEYVDGEDLASLLRRIGRVPQDKAIEIARQLCAGLAAAHERGVLHRDLKPANVMLDGEGNVRLTDFGLAVIEGDAAAARAGTPQYMAPEQLRGEPPTVRSDIYALGLVLYELFTGRRAFEAKTFPELLRLHETGTLTTPSSVVHDLDPAVERAIVRCVERDPAGRPATALAVAAALPGADPLAAALAAGETPSPELLIAAGETAAVPVGRALAAAALALTAIVVFVVLGARASITALVPLEKPPAVLIDHIQQMTASFGYTDAPADSAYGFAVPPDSPAWAQSTSRRPDWWSSLASASPPALVFWYRTSPRPMAPSRPVAEVTPTDPPTDVSGMLTVLTDTRGRLVEFHAAPPQFDPSSAPAPPPRWKLLFDAAGLDMDAFHGVAPEWTPHDFADARQAWEGPLADRPDIQVRVEAAAYKGRPSSFSVV